MVRGTSRLNGAKRTSAAGAAPKDFLHSTHASLSAPFAAPSRKALPYRQSDRHTTLQLLILHRIRGTWRPSALLPSQRLPRPYAIAGTQRTPRLQVGCRNRNSADCRLATCAVKIGVTGFEPATSTSRTWHSSQAELHPDRYSGSETKDYSSYSRDVNVVICVSALTPHENQR